jgi:hypothetical protein
MAFPGIQMIREWQFECQTYRFGSLETLVQRPSKAFEIKIVLDRLDPDARSGRRSGPPELFGKW